MTAPDAPEAGDLVWVDLDPVRGSEQAGARPVLVISSGAYNRAGLRAIVCPVTSNTAPWPTKVPLPDGSPVRGAVLADQVRTLDRRARGYRKIGKAPPEVLQAVRDILKALIDDAD